MKRILVIDDDVQVRQMLRQMLEREGYEVVDAPDGEEGIRLYRDEPADLIITDIIMPEKEGIGTIFALRRDFPGVKIIAISGGGRFVHKDDCLDLCRANGIPSLSKPFDRKELLEVIQKLLANALVS